MSTSSNKLIRYIHRLYALIEFFKINKKKTFLPLYFFRCGPLVTSKPKKKTGKEDVFSSSQV